MRIGFIGAGKVGTSFGIYLKNNGYIISGYYSRTKNSANESAKLTDSKSYDGAVDLIKDSELVFITTPDDDIQRVFNNLESYFLESNCILAHMSGSITSDVFNGVKLPFASIHPLQAFSDIQKSVLELKDCIFCIEGNTDGKLALENIITHCGNKLISIDKDKKALYHATACVLSNYTMILTSLAEKFIGDMGNEIDLSVYRKLMIGSIDNAINFGSINALTGPISRGDLKTINAHIHNIRNQDLVDEYKKLGMMTLKIAKEQHRLSGEQICELTNVLNTAK